MGYISQEIIEFYNSINSVTELIRSDSYIESTNAIKLSLLIEYKEYFGYENIDTYSYKQELCRLISIKRKINIENELDSISTIDEKLIILKKYKAKNMFQKASDKIDYNSRHPEINEFDLLDEYLDAYIGEFEIMKQEENINPLENNIAMSIPIDIEDQERFVYCHKFGIINFLMDHIKSDGTKYTDTKLYKYLALITNISESTIKRLMTFTKSEINSDPNNPFKKIDLMERVNRIIMNNNMITKDYKVDRK